MVPESGGVAGRRWAVTGILAMATLAMVVLLAPWSEHQYTGGWPPPAALGQGNERPDASVIHGIVYNMDLPPDLADEGQPPPGALPVAEGSEITVVVQATGELLEGERLGPPNNGLTSEGGAMAIRIAIEGPDATCPPCRLDSEIQFFVNGEDARTQPRRITLRDVSQRVNVYAKLPEPAAEEGSLTDGSTPGPGSEEASEEEAAEEATEPKVLEEFRPPQVVMGKLYLNGEPAGNRTTLEAHWNDDSRYLAGRTHTNAKGDFRIEIKRQVPDPEDERVGYRPAAGDDEDRNPVNPLERCPQAGKPLITFTAVLRGRRVALDDGTYWEAGNARYMDLSDDGREPSTVFSRMVYNDSLISAWRENPEHRENREDPALEVWYNYMTTDMGGATSNMGPLYAGQCILLNMREEDTFQNITMTVGWNAVAIR